MDLRQQVLAELRNSYQADKKSLKILEGVSAASAFEERRILEAKIKWKKEMLEKYK